jgi:hypothetical protein
MPSATTTPTTKRQRRIERRCIAPVVEALHAGQISPRSADVFLRLTPEKQKVELECRLAEIAECERQHAITARTIREYLDGLGGRKVDLVALNQRIREAIT